jgi:hypothetical protein
MRRQVGAAAKPEREPGGDPREEQVGERAGGF